MLPNDWKRSVDVEVGGGMALASVGGREALGGGAKSNKPPDEEEKE